MKFPLKRAAPLAGHQAIIPTRRLKQFFQEKIAADAHRFRRASCSMSDRKQRYGNAMGTSSVCVRSVVEFSGGNGATGEIRTPDPQIRSLGDQLKSLSSGNEGPRGRDFRGFPRTSTFSMVSS